MENSSGATILIVDDFEDTRLMMKLWLEKKGYRIVTAADGMEALMLAERESPDLIIMDLEMPKLNGLDATRRIREQEKMKNVPIIAVSAYGAEQFREAALEAGCNEYISTPFVPDELAEVLNRFLA